MGTSIGFGKKLFIQNFQKSLHWVDMVKNYIKLGVHRKDFLKDTSQAYDGLMLPGNMLLHQYKAIPATVYKTEKPFFVDPMSYLFGNPFEHFKKKIEHGYEFKPSFEKLVLAHGLSPQAILNLKAKDMVKKLSQDNELSKSFVKGALRLQSDNVKKAKDFIKEVDESLLEENAYPLTPDFSYSSLFDY